MVIWVKIFKTEKTIEIHLVRLTEVCGKVLSDKYAYKSVETALLLSNDADHQNSCLFTNKPLYYACDANVYSYSYSCSYSFIVCHPIFMYIYSYSKEGMTWSIGSGKDCPILNAIPILAMTPFNILYNGCH